MNKHPFFALLTVIATLSCAAGAALGQSPEEALSAKKVTPPNRISYDERDLRYNKDWKSEEVYLEASLDDKPGKEVVISFIASYKPKPETDTETKDPFDTIKRAIPIVQNYAFVQVYHQDAGGHYRCVKTINGMDRPQTLRLLALNEKNPQALAIISPGGENYTDVTILRWQDGGYRTLLTTGASGDVEIFSDNDPVTLRIGSQTWRWNNDRNVFEIIVKE